MIKGIYIGEDGTVQQIGQLTTLTNIIAAVKELLPQLEVEHRKSLTSELTEEELMALLTEKKTAKAKESNKGPEAKTA